MLSPRRVRPGNFTLPEKTPWGGRKIVSTYKRGLPLDLSPSTRVGESWEVSTEPSSPSVLEDGLRLADAIAQNPVGWLGHRIAETYDRQNPLLLKLIDPELTLSLQVHPLENHEILAPDESGKSEAWIVLEAEPGASIFVGFLPGVTKANVERHVAAGWALEPLLNRVEVQSGDVFMIRPGVVHALGAGVTVLEPQRVRPGRRAVTYRIGTGTERSMSTGKILAVRQAAGASHRRISCRRRLDSHAPPVARAAIVGALTWCVGLAR